MPPALVHDAMAAGPDITLFRGGNHAVESTGSQSTPLHDPTESTQSVRFIRKMHCTAYVSALSGLSCLSCNDFLLLVAKVVVYQTHSYKAKKMA